MVFPTTAELVKEIWQEVLGIEVDRETDFFETSGDSLSAMRIYAKLAETLEVSLPLAALFDNPRFGDFTAVVRNEISTMNRNAE
ncbi:phosphopantetheine-binding protein [Streptomyces sp. NBC_01298]|uniref:phosphopantetheine-binding protein n=1 Tax=Streptomyces sp. NBC_01298 TaxID=2903817 RepID=UPI002E0D43ED|nr:phosphopantetheine-binding protein [Streptomyces sp. NBC_01298]